MDIIELKGPRNSGKTSALGMLYAFMAHTPGAALIWGPKTISGIKKDFQAAFDFPGRRAGRKKIALYTEGDNPASIRRAVKTFAPLADILIVPNSTPQTMNTIIQGSPHTVLHTVQKTIAPPSADASAFYIGSLAVNMADAQAILSLL